VPPTGLRVRVRVRVRAWLKGISWPTVAHAVLNRQIVLRSGGSHLKEDQSKVEDSRFKLQDWKIQDSRIQEFKMGQRPEGAKSVLLLR